MTWKTVANIGGVLPALFGLQVSYTSAKVIGAGLMALAAVVTSWGVKTVYDRAVVRKHTAEVRADAAEGARHADQQADRKAVKRDKAAAEVDRRIGEAARKAAASDPVGAAESVGPVTSSYYDNLPEEK